MVTLLILLVCAVAVLIGVAAMLGMVFRKRIRIPWLLLAAAAAPAVATGLLVAEPWFAVGGDWRWLRLLLLFSWVPALAELDRRGHFVCATASAKWLCRGTLSGVLLLFSLWTAGGVEGWGLIQAHADWNKWCWLAERDGGEDGVLFTRFGDGPLQSEKILDSVGSPTIYSYSIRWAGEKVEIRSPESEYVGLYDPKTRIEEYEKSSGERHRYNRATRVSEKWDPKAKAWVPGP